MDPQQQMIQALMQQHPGAMNGGPPGMQPPTPHPMPPPMGGAGQQGMQGAMGNNPLRDQMLQGMSSGGAQQQMTDPRMQQMMMQQMNSMMNTPPPPPAMPMGPR